VDILTFQYCPKLVVLNEAGSHVLLCRRKGEQDYDSVFSLIGGKMEHRDSSIVEALHREKSEEVGENFKVKVLPYYSVDVLFIKKDGSHMILPHFLARHTEGEIVLSEEYSEYAWVRLSDVSGYAPKIANISWIVPALVRIVSVAAEKDFVEI
jgi:ADP-ribose pyrophosphatase YjhB (NUDIX family)